VRVTVPSFAKTNLSLEILGRRSDGFHELLTVLQTLDYSDELSFEVPADEIALSIAGRDVASGRDNLIWAAAHLIKERCHIDQGVQIGLKKHIPVGAGLGGGSSNAAVTLIALNQLWNCELTRSDLVQLASQLGSDVPFFLTGGTGLGWGRGEQICSLPEMAREFSMLVYYPRFQVSAAEAYSELGDLPVQLTRPDLNTTIRRFREVLEAGDWSILRNDLEEAVFSRYPLLAARKRALLAAGCEFGMLSGSGSALIGISTAGSLEHAKEHLQESGDADIILCGTLSRQEYLDRLRKAGVRTDLFLA